MKLYSIVYKDKQGTERIIENVIANSKIEVYNKAPKSIADLRQILEVELSIDIDKLIDLRK